MKSFIQIVSAIPVFAWAAPFESFTSWLLFVGCLVIMLIGYDIAERKYG